MLGRARKAMLLGYCDPNTDVKRRECFSFGVDGLAGLRSYDLLRACQSEDLD